MIDKMTAMRGRARRAAAALMAVLMAALVALSLMALTACGNEDKVENEGAGDKVADERVALSKVTVLIDVSAAVEEGDATALELETTLGANKSFALDVSTDTTILEALRATGLQVVTEKASLGEYVTAINLLESGALGAESGWTFLVNDEFALEGADVMKVNDGDTITWRYVTKYE
jgi:hypothetical protein